MDEHPAGLSLSAIIAGGWLSDAEALEEFASNEWLLAKTLKDEKLYEEAGVLRRSAFHAGQLATDARQRYSGYWEDPGSY